MATSSQSDLVRQVMSVWCAQKEAALPPDLRVHVDEAVVVPQLVVDALGLPESRLDLVGRIFDQNVRQAIASTVEAAQALR